MVSGFHERIYSPGGLQILMTAGFPDKRSFRSTSQKKILHPYLGFGVHPRHPLGNQYGFYGAEPIFQKLKDKAVVGFFGGSFALGLIASSRALIKGTLESSEAFEGRDVELVCLAVDGFKQPQSLIALSYLLSIGAEFDVVVNVDGFNEVVLPYTENIPAGVYAFYPRSWDLYTRQGFRRDVALRIVGIEDTLEKLEDFRRWAQRFPFRWSVFCVTLADIWGRRIEAEVYEQDSQLRKVVSNTYRASVHSGPQQTYSTDLSFFRHAVEAWRKASSNMAQLCRANGIEYFHFLQPNQYYTGSKTLSPMEKKIAFVEGESRLKKAVTLGYPLLVEGGDLLAERGINFFSLTQVFNGERRTVYIDPCCHTNDFGHEIVAKEIARFILGKLESD